MLINWIKNFYYNALYFVNPMKKKRSKDIILFGAWFGKRFADNSRFLYQWLSKNKFKLGLSHVVWVSNEQKIVDELNQKKYEAYLMNSKESKYYHNKAGIIFICQSYTEDVLGKYCNGAVKINLWHGLGGIKGVDRISNEYINRKQRHPKYFLFKEWFEQKKPIKRLFSSIGGWSYCFYLSTTPYETSIFRKYFARFDDCFIESDWPRNCKCIELMPSEQKVIDFLSKWELIILYLPTFRENVEHYVDPLSDNNLRTFLCNNNILWVEKQHSYSTHDFDSIQSKNILKLDPNFDINVIVRKATFVITDYSSVSMDALYNDIPTVFYIPDFDYYATKDRGFVMKPEEFVFGPQADTSEKLLDVLELYKGKYSDMLPKNKNEIFEKMWGTKKDYFEIWQDITSFINSHPKGGI